MSKSDILKIGIMLTQTQNLKWSRIIYYELGFWDLYIHPAIKFLPHKNIL